MRMVVIFVRNDEAVYKAAERRIRDMIKNNRTAKKIMRSAPWRDFGGLLLEAAESPAQALRTL